MFKRRGLAFKLSIYILTAVFIILFSLLYYNYIISRNLALDDAKKDAQKLTELTVARIENVLDNVENLPVNLASIIEYRDTVRFVGTRNVIETVFKRNPLVYGASIAFAPEIHNNDTIYDAPYIYNTGDSIAFKNLADDNYNYTGHEWYKEAKKLRHGIWTQPYYDKGGGDVLMATYSVPWYYQKEGAERRFGGVVTADISLHGLQNLINDIQFFKSGKGFLISHLGNIVTFPGIDTSNNTQIFNVFEGDFSPQMMQVFQKMVDGEKGIISMQVLGENNNLDRWVSFANVSSANWSLGIIFHEHELYASIHQLYLKLIAIGLAGFVILAFLIFYIAGRFVKPIEKLAFATRKIGAGDFSFQIPSFRSKDEIAQLGKSFSIMQLELKDYIRDLKETTAQKEKMESELEIANNIQQQMLPQKDALAGVGAIDCFGVLKPAKSVGGDLYDFIFQDGELYFAIGDVSGKGIPAALFMAKTLTLFRSKVSGGKGPSEIAEEINLELEKYNNQSMFVTFFIGKLTLSTGKLLYTNAGHNLPFLVEEGKDPEPLKGTHGIPLGSMPDMQYEESSLVILPSNKIVLYTDGISEAEDINHKLYGEDRLSKLIKSNAAKSPDELAESILSDVNIFAGAAEQFDDITLLILDYHHK